jgi:HlyD family secretion protein
VGGSGLKAAHLPAVLIAAVHGRELDPDGGNLFLRSRSTMAPDKQALDELRIDRAKPRRGVPVALIVVLLFIVAAAAVAFWWFNRPKPAVVRTLIVQQSSSGSDKTSLNASGYVKARREATVSSKVTGKVVEVLVEEGMKVEAGQILARLDSSNVEKSLHLAEAQAESARKALDETKANLEQAERDFRRWKKLSENQIATPAELDKSEAEVKSLTARLGRQQADVAVAEREVALWQQQVDDTIIRAPFAGIVTTKNAQPGEMISPMSSGGFTRTGICTLVDMSSLEIEVDVNESFINRVQAGQPVEATLDSYPDWRIPSKVIAIIPTADRNKATVKVRVGFEKLDPRILPDMSVKVVFQTTSEARTAPRSLTIPRSAVRQIDGKNVVWIIRDERVERRAITPGEERGETVTVTAGLNGGEKIVVEGADKLTEGSRVTEEIR